MKACIRRTNNEFTTLTLSQIILDNKGKIISIIESNFIYQIWFTVKNVRDLVTIDDEYDKWLDNQQRKDIR